MLEKLLEPTNIGALQLKNRIMIPPHAMCYAGPAGEVTQRQIDYLVRRARSGAALIALEDACVDSSYGKWGPGAQLIDHDRYIPMYSKVVQQIHRAGAKATVQLSLALGSAVPETLDGKQPATASEIPAVEEGVMTRALEIEEIERLVEAFAEAARRARDAGFDAVNILGAEGYGINQFVSPHYNHRTDAYGGTLEKRMRFPLEIVQAVKAKVGADFPIIWDLATDEFLDDGLTLADAQITAQMLEEAGVDCFRIQRGNYYAYHAIIPPWNFPPGAFVPLAAAIKKVVKRAKVECDGRITDPRLAEKILEDGDADIIGLVRAFIADPEWLHKAEQGRFQDIRKCIACTHCMDFCWAAQPVECAVNPEVGHEADVEYSLRPAAKAKKVVVIGGGPGGMETARVAATRGHDVSLYDRRPRLGGLLAKGAVISDELDDYLQYLRTQMKECGVKVHVSEEVTPALVGELEPDVLVVATGATAMPLKIGGADRSNVLSPSHLPASDENNRIVVLGDELVGYEMAHFFHTKGKDVTLIKVPEDLVDGELLPLIPFLRDNLPLDFSRKGITIVTDVAGLEITHEGVVVTGESGETTTFPADRVVMTPGSKASDAVYEEMKGQAAEVYRVGDCVEPRGILDAVKEGAAVGRTI